MQCNMPVSFFGLENIRKQKRTYKPRDTWPLRTTEILISILLFVFNEPFGDAERVPARSLLPRLSLGSGFRYRTRSTADESLCILDAVLYARGPDILFDRTDQLFGEGEAIHPCGTLHAEPEGVHTDRAETMGLEAGDKGFGGDGDCV